jgi:hypothetical protein
MYSFINLFSFIFKGTYGLVSVLNATLTGESSNDSINDSNGVKDFDTTMAPAQC